MSRPHSAVPAVAAAALFAAFAAPAAAFPPGPDPASCMTEQQFAEQQAAAPMTPVAEGVSARRTESRLLVRDGNFALVERARDRRWCIHALGQSFTRPAEPGARQRWPAVDRSRSHPYDTVTASAQICAPAEQLAYVLERDGLSEVWASASSGPDHEGVVRLDLEFRVSATGVFAVLVQHGPEFGCITNLGVLRSER